MRTDSMLILFLILTSFSTTTVQKNEPSDLRQVSENLRVLSRITNAIHLHFVATQPHFKLHQITSEVLRISEQDFIGIISFAASLTKNELSKMQIANKNYLKDPQKANLELNEISMAVQALNLWLSLSRQVDILEDLKNKKNVEITSKIDHGEIMKKCEEINPENFHNLQSLFDDDPTSYKLPTDPNNKTQETMELFVKQSKTIQDCMGNLTKLEAELNSLEILKTYEANENERKIRKLAEDFLMFYETGEKLLETISKLMRNIELSVGIWEPFNEEGLTSHDLMGTLYNSTTSFKKFQNNFDRIELAHTAGYRNSRDFLQVFKDLKNPWFLKNIAKGTSTKNLTQALEKYRNISQMIVNMDDDWKKMINESTSLITPELENAAGILESITRLAPDIKKWKPIVTTTAELITGFFNQLNVSTNVAELLVKYDEEQRPVETVVHQIQKIQQKIASSSIYPKSQQDSNSVIELLDVFQSVGAPVCKQYLAVDCIFMTKKELIRNGARDLKFFELLKEFAEIVKDMDELIVRQAVSVDPTVSIGQIVEKLKLDEFAKEFRNNTKNIKIVISFFNFLKDIMEFPNNEQIKKLNTYINNFENVQNRVVALGSMLELKRSNRTKSSNFVILPLNNSKALNENLGDSLKVLEDIEKARTDRDRLLPKQQFSNQTLKFIGGEGLRDWIDPTNAIKEILGKADNLNKLAGKVKGKDVFRMAEVFENAAGIKGMIGRQKQLSDVYDSLEREFKEKANIKDPHDMNYFGNARKHDLDFARHHSQLTNARVTIDSLKTYFDEVFGHTSVKIKKDTVTIERQIPVSYTAIILIGAGFLLLVFIIVMAVYGLTESGRTFYGNLYLYYFGKTSDFEKRWRYSMFMDTVDGKNVILDAAREGNKSNLLRALKHGAYIDAYNKFGNTALHMATKFAQPDLVRLLITYGADRSLLNLKNLTPIQMIPLDYEKKFPDKTQAYEKIKKIYKKYDRKSFRCSVPRVFPMNSFKIYPDESTDVSLTNDFLDAFRAIVSDEPSPQTTHVVYKTDKDGVLVTDSLDALYWIFHGAIIVKEQWMTDCLSNEKLIRKDSDYLIEKVKYKGVVYDTVLAWSEAMAKATMPYLTGIFVTVVADNFKNLMPLSSIVTSQGGIVLSVFPYKQLFNLNSKPYLHANLGPLFLIHDGRQDMDTYRNDPDKMYTVFTEEEFMVFMLKREMQRDNRPNPPSVLIQEE